MFNLSVVLLFVLGTLILVASAIPQLRNVCNLVGGLLACLTSGINEKIEEGSIQECAGRQLFVVIATIFFVAAGIFAKDSFYFFTGLYLFVMSVMYAHRITTTFKVGTFGIYFMYFTSLFNSGVLHGEDGFYKCIWIALLGVTLSQRGERRLDFLLLTAFAAFVWLGNRWIRPGWNFEGLKSWTFVLQSSLPIALTLYYYLTWKLGPEEVVPARPVKEQIRGTSH